MSFLELNNGLYINDQMYYGGGAISLGDSPSVDAFSRLRVSNPLILHNSQFTYDLCPLIYQQITGGAATITHDTTNRCAEIVSGSAGSSGDAYMQTFEYFVYQPGRSQLIFITFNMRGLEQDTTVIKYAGYSDGNNGIELQLTSDGTKQFVIYSGTTTGNETVTQANWNLDKLDGSGISGITLDLAKTQILVIDLQALYVGRVRIGFDIGGQIIYAHQFTHANVDEYPYIQTANLPVRCGIIDNGTNLPASMLFICSAVISEGGSEDLSSYSYSFEKETGAISVGTGGTHMLSLRPKTTFNGFANRVKIAFIDVEIFNSGNQPVYWELCLGQAISGTTTYNDVNTTYSATEFNILGTLSGSPSIVIDSGYVSSSGSSRVTVNTVVSVKYPITLDRNGNPRALGTLTLKCTSLSGTQTVYGVIKFREIR